MSVAALPMKEVQNLQKQADHEIAWQRNNVAKLEYLLLVITVLSLGFAVALTREGFYSWHFILWGLSVVLMAVSLGYGMLYISNMMKSNQYLMSSFLMQVNYFGRRESIAEKIRSSLEVVNLHKQPNENSSAHEQTIRVLRKQLDELHAQNIDDALQESIKIKQASDYARKALLKQLALLGLGYVFFILWHASLILAPIEPIVPAVSLMPLPNDTSSIKHYSTPLHRPLAKTPEMFSKEAAIRKLEPIKMYKEVATIQPQTIKKEVHAKVQEPKVMIWWSKDERK
ncbi:MAG: hypothetical protein V4525_02660 [Pseudomonadota bacterium]